MTFDISIVLPAKNEAGNIEALLLDISRVMADADHEIIVVDDASTDQTRDVLARLRRRMPQLRVVCHQSSCGQSAAIRSGILAAKGRIIATLDADGQNPPENLPDLLRPCSMPPRATVSGLCRASGSGARIHVRNDGPRSSRTAFAAGFWATGSATAAAGSRHSRARSI
ncbi:glycosyltransferase family 2 protein [Paracoccus cavernae]|uniref:Glycosyltransferase family 2 protein n=1 Tax=Paracoccus cavernae TaxID=1571207 RepID=A0ABT8D744_9RHOB|nr:glycosyltransferase family 2 protein [Paracoccus cavernae]